MAVLLTKELGEPINDKRVKKLMKEAGELSRVRRRKYSEEVYATRRMLKAKKIPDLIGRDFTAIEPGIRFVEDITYLPAIEGTWYLNSIEDLYNGEIVAYCIGKHPDTQLCLDTVRKLLERYGEENLNGSILHSDGGSSYISMEYSFLLKDKGIRQSMGRRATCYDNAAMESLNGIIKTEALYNKFGKSKVKDKRVTIEQVKEAVESFIDYYNNERPKKALGWLSPVAFRDQNPNGKWLIPYNPGMLY